MQVAIAMYFTKVQNIVSTRVQTVVVFSISSVFSDEKISIQRAVSELARIGGGKLSKVFVGNWNRDVWQHFNVVIRVCLSYVIVVLLLVITNQI